MSNSPVARVWTFSSSSNPNKTYETLQYTDGSTSCNCPGWTRRVAADGSRTCKHTRLVDQGLADSESVSHKDYESGVAASVKAQPVKVTKAKKYEAPKEHTPVVRKIQW